MHKLKIAVLSFVTLLANDSYSQTIPVKKITSRIVFNVSGLQSIQRSSDVEHWNNPSPNGATPQFLKVQNSSMYQLGVGYELKLKNNLVFGAELIFGDHRSKYQWDFTFDKYSTVYDFSSYSTTRKYENDVPYGGLKITAGYDYKPSNKSKVTLQCRASLNYIKFFNNEDKTELLRLNYKIADTGFSSPIAYLENLNYNSVFYYDLYFGVGYPIKTKVVKEVQPGVSFNHALGLKHKLGYVSGAHSLYYNSTGALVAGDEYHDPFRNIVLKIGITF